MPIKDGQFSWGALGFCVSALYEIAEPSAQGGALDAGFKGWVTGGFVFLLLANAILAAGGAIFSTPLAAAPLPTPWYRYYTALAASAVLTLLSGGAYTAVHYYLNGA